MVHGQIRALAVLAVAAVLAAAVIPVTRAEAPSSPPRPVFVALARWGFNATTLQAYPGASYLPLTVTLLYEGPVTLYDVNVTLNATYPLSPVQGEPTPALTVLELQPGQELTLVGLFNVSPSASPGAYNETLEVAYLVEVPTPSGSVYVRGVSQVRFVVPVTGYPDVIVLGFSTTPPLVYAGMTAGELRVYVSNRGTAPAVNVTAFLNLSSPLYPLYPASNVIHIAYLPPGHVVNMTFPFGVSNVTEAASTSFGSFRVPEPVNVTSYLTVSGNGFRETFPISVYIAPSAYFVYVASYHPRLAPGSSNAYLTVSIGNAGTGEGEFVTATLLPNPVLTPYISSSENPVLAMSLWNYTVGDVRPGSEFNVTFVISVSSAVRPGTYYLPLLITWLQPPTMQPMHEVVLVPVKVSTSPSLISTFSSLSTTELVLVAVAVIVVIIIVVMAAVGRRRA